MVPLGSDRAVDMGQKPANAKGYFHTHPNIGGRWTESHGPKDIIANRSFHKTWSYVIGRQNLYSHYYTSYFSNLMYSNFWFNPYPYFNIIKF